MLPFSRSGGINLNTVIRQSVDCQVLHAERVHAGVDLVLLALIFLVPPCLVVLVLLEGFLLLALEVADLRLDLLALCLVLDGQLHLLLGLLGV